MPMIDKQIATTRVQPKGYYGRNRYGKVTGYDFSFHTAEDHLAICPMNTHGHTMACQINVPLADLDLFIATLQGMKLEIARAKLLQASA